MEYKDLIKTAYCCDIKACDDCPSKGRTCCRERAMQELSHALDKEAARAESAESAQETLQRAVAEYKARSEKAERERDAAVNDLKKEVMGKIWACDYCKKNDPDDFQCTHDDLCGCHEWEWRGQKE